MIFLYPTWSCAQVAREQYVRVAQQAPVKVVAKNLLNRNLRGSLHFRGGAIAAPGTYTINFIGANGQTTSYTADAKTVWDRYSGAIWDLTIPDAEFAPGEQTLRWLVTPAQSGQPVGAYVLEDLRFTAAQETPSP